MWMLKKRIAMIALIASLVTVSVSAPVSAVITPPVCGASGTPTVVQMADPNFHVDLDNFLDSNYAAYTVTGGDTAYIGVSTSLSTFTGGSIDLADPAANYDVVGNLAASGLATSYFFLRASTETASAQTHIFTLSSQGAPVCTKSFSYTGVYDTIKAAANKVNSVVTVSTRTPAQLGDVVTVTVEGDTGVLGAGPDYDPQMLSITPNSNFDFPTSAWRLERTELTISPDGDVDPELYIDDLFITSASGPNRPYTVKYFYRAYQSLGSTTVVSPIQYIASGTQVKHTEVGTVGSLPIISDAIAVQLTKSASPTALPSAGGDSTYTVRITNNDTSPIVLDRIVDTIPATSIYNTASSTLDTVAIADPVVDGSTLTWWGPFEIAAGDFEELSYTLKFDGTPGVYTNSVIAYVGSAQIDANGSLSSNVSAKTDVFVGIAVLNATKTISSTTDTDSSGDLTPGDVINYLVTVTNNGEANAADVAIADPLTGDSEDCGTLEPAASCTLTTSYTVLTADQGASITNTANITSSDTAATSASVVSSVVTTPTPTPTPTPTIIGPTARPVTSTGNQGTTQLISLNTSAGDYSIVRDGSTVALCSDGPFVNGVIVPAVGTFTVNNDLTVTFTPVGTFNTTLTICYKIIDQAGQVATSTITVTVTPLVVLAMPPKVTCTKIIGTVYFDASSAILTARTKDTLRTIAEQINRGGFDEICLKGHTDMRNSVRSNNRLSNLRVRNVQTYLNIYITSATKRIEATYFGELSPAVPGTSKTSMARNRRVDISIG